MKKWHITVKDAAAMWFSPFVALAEELIHKTHGKEERTDSGSPARKGEVRAPWVEFPDFPPYHFFWRDAGQPWVMLVWKPYYDGLSPEAQQEYLAYWNVPQDWNDYYFDEEFQKMLRDTDEPEERRSSTGS